MKCIAVKFYNIENGEVELTTILPYTIVFAILLTSDKSLDADIIKAWEDVIIHRFILHYLNNVLNLNDTRQ